MLFYYLMYGSSDGFCSFPEKRIIWKEEGFTNVIMKAVLKFTPKVHILKRTGVPTQEKNHTSAPGRAVHGDLHALMNSLDTTENIPAQNLLNAHTVTDAFQGRIICHFTWSGTENFLFQMAFC